MIKFYLKAKHWQLFLLMLGIPLFFEFLVILDIGIFNVFPIIMLLFIGVLFGWFWSIAIGLQKYVPQEIRMKVKKFKVFFFIPLIYMVFLTIYMSGIFSEIGINGFSKSGWIVAIILPLHLFSMFSIFYSIYFVARTLKTVELQRKVGFGDYVGEFFMIWFYFIGMWIIQPKVNKLYRNGNTTANKELK
ncbi:hypothetical protein INR76_12785 [Marixanthomonas sp. SCSIO 43207]|uniref:hypothetical protein n=1 Tax=Marixanthomonas sp. SCSIO 43207 TaxID=2779360 RepID=UPI001CA8960D|nr:hypothetical protein [Marixanthomonas sp. SCSIO 43207]UAB80966.1 hypothetical protein INR76_12785 [Marixanthomonas sp. SCSIO 43207]